MPLQYTLRSVWYLYIEITSFLHMISTHSQIEYSMDAIDFNRKDEPKPSARRGCSAYASEIDTTNIQSSIVNIQYRLVPFWLNIRMPLDSACVVFTDLILILADWRRLGAHGRQIHPKHIWPPRLPCAIHTPG